VIFDYLFGQINFTECTGGISLRASFLSRTARGQAAEQVIREKKKAPEPEGGRANQFVG
jgi:hypothetical protein